jgi:GNAT acetyltransferase-like protein
MTIRPSERATAPPRAVRVDSPAPRAEWERIFESDADAVATQSPQWLDCLRSARGYADASRLYELSDGRRLVLPLAARLRGGVRITEESWPYGWGYGGLLADGGGVTESDVAVVLADLARRPVVRVAITPMPLQAARWAAVAPPRAHRVPYTTRVLDLLDGFDAVWKRYRQTARRWTRKAERLGVDVRPVSGADSFDALAAFADMYRRSVDRWAEQRGQPLRIARLLAERRDVPGQVAAAIAGMGRRCVLWSATLNGEPLAVNVVLRGATQDMWWVGTMDTEAARSTGATYLLQTRMAEDACTRGVRHLHLGESDPGSGVDDFKAGFGARRVDYDALRLERVPLSRAEHAMRSAFGAVSSWNRRRTGA